MMEGGRVSDLQLERYLLGELGDEDRRALEERLSRDELLAARLEHLRSSNDEILSRYPPEEMAASIVRRTDESTSPGTGVVRRGRSLVALVPVAAAIAALAILLPIRLGRDDLNRVKGLESRLVIHRQSAFGPQELSPGSTAAGGDVLQVSYVAGGARYGVIVSLDGNGTITMHFPEGGDAAGRLEPSGLMTLPYAYELDDAPGFERFFLVTSKNVFPIATVLDAVARLKTEEPSSSDLDLPKPLEQSSFLVVKKGG